MKLRIDIDISNRVTPENINELKDNEIFCFGANLAGRHGAGAAKLAFDKFGAKWGQGVGLYGKTYAIPTKNKKIETMDLYLIYPYVKEFIEDCKFYSQNHFLVTKVGCGLAGIPLKDMANLFKNAIFVENISLPLEFWFEYGKTK